MLARQLDSMYPALQQLVAQGSLPLPVLCRQSLCIFFSRQCEPLRLPLRCLSCVVQLGPLHRSTNQFVLSAPSPRLLTFAAIVYLHSMHTAPTQSTPS